MDAPRIFAAEQDAAGSDGPARPLTLREQVLWSVFGLTLLGTFLALLASSA